MPVVLIVLAVVMIVAAYNNSQGTLVTALAGDVAGFGKWFGALVLIGGLGFIPKFESPSRWLLGLVLLVIFLTNYRAVIAGFSSIGAGTGTTAHATQVDPFQAYAANPANPTITTASITGTPAGGATSTAVAQDNTASPFDPQALLHRFEGAFGVA